MTNRQRKYLVNLIKKVFRNEDSQSEMLSITDNQASAMIHALRLEYNIYRTIPSCMYGARNLNPKMDSFFKYLGFNIV